MTNFAKLALRLNEATQSATEISGNSQLSLGNATRLAASADIELQPGWIIIAGSPTPAEALTAGVRARTVVQELGATDFSVRNQLVN